MKFGILGDAKIAREKLIPAMRAGGHEIVCLGRRDPSQPTEYPIWQGVRQTSYEQMLADPQVEAVYNPLPNHLHVPMSIKALQAGKPVLCEKPMALTLAELDQLEAAAQKSGCFVYEAFMVRHHPQWHWLRGLDIGARQLVMAQFSYPPPRSDNIRNYAGMGGGPIWDIGCYCVLSGMMLFGTKPTLLSITKKPAAGLDVEEAASALLDFGDGRVLTMQVSAAASLSQSVYLLGSKGWAQLTVPFNPPPVTTARWARAEDRRTGLLGAGESLQFEACDQYQLMLDDFAAACADKRPADFTDSRALTGLLSQMVAA